MSAREHYADSGHDVTELPSRIPTGSAPQAPRKPAQEARQTPSQGGQAPSRPQQASNQRPPLPSVSSLARQHTIIRVPDDDDDGPDPAATPVRSQAPAAAKPAAQTRQPQAQIVVAPRPQGQGQGQGQAPAQGPAPATMKAQTPTQVPAAQNAGQRPAHQGPNNQGPSAAGAMQQAQVRALPAGNNAPQPHAQARQAGPGNMPPQAAPGSDVRMTGAPHLGQPATSPSAAPARQRDPNAPKGDWHVDPRDLSPDPLLSCLYEVARLLGKPMSREAISSGLPLDGEHMTPRLFLRAANQAGFVARITTHDIDRRMAPLCPAVALLSDERAVLITEIDRDRAVARIIYPQAPGAPVEMALDDLNKQSTGYIISVKTKLTFEYRTADRQKGDGSHWFWGTLAKPWRTYRDVILASVLLNLFALAVPLYTMNVYDRVVPNSAFETLWTFSIGVAAVLVFDMLMKILRAWFIDHAAKRVDQQLASQIMAKVMNMRLEARPASVGSFASNLRAFESVREFMTSASIGMLVDVPFALLFIVVIGVLGGPLVLGPICAVVATVILATVVQRQMKPLTDSQQRANQQKHGSLIEGLIGIETIKAMNVEGRIQKRWEEANAYLAITGGKVKLWSAIAVNGTGMITQMVTIGMVIGGVYLISDNALTMGALIACSQLAGRAIAPLGQLSSLLIQYDNALSAYDGINRIMGLPEERPDDANFVLRPKLKGGFSFQNVTFKYPNADTPALRNATFAVKPGERIAIIGKVGSGKSTIEKLLLGLYQPTSGTINFDGVDSKQIDPTEVRTAIGYVPQDLTLFQGTLRENIALGAPWADDTMILRAASLAGLRQFIAQHPKGLHMHIGERGDSLSGGQRQAVAIARALIHEPPMMILDEPTSAMDNETEAQVLKNLRDYMKGRTLILVTHRMSLVDLVDRLIVVDQGRIVADGPKQKVIAALSGAMQ